MKMFHNVLIIGATGYIGGAVTRKISETANMKVFALVRPTSDISVIKSYCNGIIQIPCGKINPEFVTAAIQQNHIDTVINMRGQVGGLNTIFK